VANNDYRDRVRKNASSIFQRSTTDPEKAEEKVQDENREAEVKQQPELPSAEEKSKPEPEKKAPAKKEARKTPPKKAEKDFQARKRGRPATTRKANRDEEENIQEALDSSIRFMVTASERRRIEDYLDDEWSREQSISEVCRNALLQYLNGQEKKLEKIREKLGNLSL